MIRPWLKFYPSDWLGDEALSRSSLAAQGLWMRLVAIMHQNTADYGHMPDTPDGEAVEVARMSGCVPDEAERLLGELERRGVFSRDDLGRIYSRRMVRDAALSDTRASAGRSGGLARTFAQAKSKQVLEQTPKQNVASGIWHLSSSSQEGVQGGDRPKKAKAKPDSQTWEAVLASDEFAPLRAWKPWMDAWAEWIAHASERGTKAKVPTPTRAKAIFRKAIKAGPAVHAIAIQASIANDWQGIEPDWLKADSAEVKAAQAAESEATRRRSEAKAKAEKVRSLLPLMEARTPEGLDLIESFRVGGRGQSDAEVVASLKQQIEKAAAL